MLSCYNRGCGKDFDPENNADDSCRHHPGMPYFHDAYKGWSCCKKKSVDFTEFLNIKGCQLSKHSNVKPHEPEKPAPKVVEEEEPLPVREPVKPSALERPPFNSPLITLAPSVAPALKQSIDNLVIDTVKENVNADPTNIPVGTVCKNGGCGSIYESPASNDTECNHHPGVPIFHEGLKYWSCCTKRTTDFTAFMNQKGCEFGKHKWVQDNDESKKVNCRYDWHQTASNVVVAIYAKLYHYEKSVIKLNPVRLVVNLLFPQQDNAEFNLDIELRGIVDVSKATAHMYGTKVEITLPKAEPGHWVNLVLPRKPVVQSSESEQAAKAASNNAKEDNEDSESDVSLDGITTARGATISEI